MFASFAAARMGLISSSKTVWGKIIPLEFAQARTPIKREQPTVVKTVFTFSCSPSRRILVSGASEGAMNKSSVRREKTPMLALPKMVEGIIPKR
jgi:hypothetical protein